MSNNLMSGRINSGPNEEIRRILSLCFKKDLKERIGPYQLLEMVGNEIIRLDGKVTRPQIVSSQMASMKLGPSSSMHPLDITPIRSTNNRQMVASTLPPQ
jgi:hypothetical protein